MRILKVLMGLMCSAQICFSQAAEATFVPPQVRIVYPYPKGGIYRWPANVKLVAEATDSDGRIAKIEFFADGALIGTVTNSPYVFRWTYIGFDNVSIWLVARAYDDQGLYADSEAVPIYVTQDVFGPWVVLAEPADGALLSTQQRSRFLVKLYGTDDAAAEVQILLGTNVVAQSSDPPYEFLLSSFAPSEYTFQARGRAHGNPWNFSSVVRVRVVELRLRQPTMSNSSFQFQIEGLPNNQPYGVQVSTNLLQWKLDLTNFAGEQAEWFSEKLTNMSENRFYRVIAPPPEQPMNE